MAKVTSTKDLILLLLYARGVRNRKAEPIQGRTRLMKMLFLFEKELRKQFNLEKVVPKAALPDFLPYHYGPWSPQVYADLEFLIETGFAGVRELDSPAEPEEVSELLDSGDAYAEVTESQYLLAEEFYLTSLGRQFVNEGEAGVLTEGQWHALDEFKKRCASASLSALLRYVYTKYPKMAAESRIRDTVLRAT